MLCSICHRESDDALDYAGLVVCGACDKTCPSQMVAFEPGRNVLDSCVAAFRSALDGCISRHGVSGPEECYWRIIAARMPDQCGDILGARGYVAWQLKSGRRSAGEPTGARSKAWSCSDHAAEVGVIVFAPTAGRAKALARGAPGFESSDWTDISARRLPALDGKRPLACVLDWKRDVRMYYESCFCPEAGIHACSVCGRYHYQEIPESRLMADGPDDAWICQACFEEERARANVTHKHGLGGAS